MCKMIHMCFSHTEEEWTSPELVERGKDGFNSVAVSGAGVLRAGFARCGLRDCRPPGSAPGSSARQAETAPGLPSRSISHTCHREHFLAGHRAARLPQEAERSSRTGNDSDSQHILWTLTDFLPFVARARAPWLEHEQRLLAS